MNDKQRDSIVERQIGKGKNEPPVGVTYPTLSSKPVKLPKTKLPPVGKVKKNGKV